LSSNQVSDIEIVNSIKRSEPTPDKANANKKSNVAVLEKAIPNISNVPKSSVPTISNLPKAIPNISNITRASANTNSNVSNSDFRFDEEMKNELISQYSKGEKRNVLDPVLSNQDMNSVNSVEGERLDVNTFDVTSMFENFEKEEKQNNVNINNNNQTKKNAVVESPRNKSPKKKTTTNHRKVDTQTDEDDDDSLENDNSESDNVELKSKSSECCDACHEDFYKERQCISFTYENIDYCVCSVCFKANLKKRENILGPSKCMRKKAKVICKNSTHFGKKTLTPDEYVYYQEETEAMTIGIPYHQCTSCMVDIIATSYNKLTAPK